MNQEVKKLWVEALVSGEYKQAKGLLRRESGYCCLGVLCDIYEKQTKKKKWVKKRIWGYHFGPLNTALPKFVVKWAGLSSCNPMVKDGRGSHGSLASFNDMGRSFNQIAKYIEKSL